MVQEYVRFEEELELFDIWMKDQGFTHRTQKAYLGDVRLFLSAVAAKPIAEVEPLDVMRFLTRIRQGGAGDATRNRYLSSIRTFFTALIELKAAQHNPALQVKKSKVEKHQIPTYLDEHLLTVFFESVEGKYQTRNVVMFLLMAYAGLRVSELQRLNVADFNRTTFHLQILGKGRKWRVIPLSKPLVAAMEKALAERIPPRKATEQAFFVSQFGRRISIRTIQAIAETHFKAMKAQFLELQNRTVSSHKLRHTFATMQVRAGTDIRTLQELLGHASIQTTQIYTHVGDKQKEEAMNRVAPYVPGSFGK